jgi:hypothetical protein
VLSHDRLRDRGHRTGDLRPGSSSTRSGGNCPALTLTSEPSLAIALRTRLTSLRTRHRYGRSVVAQLTLGLVDDLTSLPTTCCRRGCG